MAETQDIAIINARLVDPATGKEVEGNEVEGVLCVKRPWPSMTRTVYGDHERYLTVYMRPYKGVCVRACVGLDGVGIGLDRVGLGGI